MGTDGSAGPKSCCGRTGHNGNQLYQKHNNLLKPSCRTAYFGCVFVSGIIGTEPGLTPTGILFGLGAGFGYALYSIFGRYALERGYGSVTITFYTFLFSSISTFLFVNPGEILKAFDGNLPIIIKTVFLVLLVTLLPYVSYTRGLKNMENGTASLLASIMLIHIGFPRKRNRKQDNQ